MSLSQTLTLNQYCTVINKASLDQLLIVIRSLVIGSAIKQKRLIVIIRLIAKLGIIYTTRRHGGVLSIKCHCHHTVLT